MKIIFGGSFDPVHNGHLRIATELSEMFGGQTVSLVPCKRPVHKPETTAALNHRIEMLKTVVGSDPALELDTREVDREGASYSYDTLESFKREGVESLIMAIGTDAALNLETWHKASELSGMCHIVVLKRPDYDDALLCEVFNRLGFGVVQDRSKLDDAVSGFACIEPVTQLQISSSDIRARVAQNMTIRYLVPDAVRQIICDNEIYIPNREV